VPEKFRLRKATPKDIDLIQEMLQANDLPTEDIPEIIDALVIASKGTTIIGIGGVERHGDFGLLRSIVIESSLRGKGYGTTLCNELIEQAKNDKINELFLLTIHAEAFFNRLGFERVPRDEIPQEMQDTAEFKTLCPISSICLQLNLV